MSTVNKNSSLNNFVSYFMKKKPTIIMTNGLKAFLKYIAIIVKFEV